MLQLLVTLQTLPKVFAHRVAKDDRGATMVEYALMVALIAVLCIVAVTFLGGSIANRFGAVGNNIASAN